MHRKRKQFRVSVGEFRISLKITTYDFWSILSNLSAAQIKKNFIPPKRATIHFDGKILTDLANETGDHLAVVLSGDTPQCHQGKLLSARRIDDGTGESQAEEVIESLKDWKAIDYVHQKTYLFCQSCSLSKPLLWRNRKKILHRIGTIVQFKIFHRMSLVIFIVWLWMTNCNEWKKKLIFLIAFLIQIRIIDSEKIGLQNNL